jgi:ketosteroid isomerase-like protein
LHRNAQLIERFYTAFQRRDGDAMAACYAPDVKFSDPVFPALVGPRAGAMWKMLCLRARDLSIEFREVQANESEGSAHWDARYSFARTGRSVLNRIDARFRFRSGLIIEHSDAFSFWRWSRQALGPAGLLLGWSPVLKNKVRKTAAEGLEEFLAKGNA